MATATKRVITKTRMVEEKYTETDGVILELTKDEANILTALIGHKVGGGNEEIMSIYRALKSQVSIYAMGVQKAEIKMTGMVQVSA